MSGITTIDCENYEGNATGTYIGELRKPEEIQIGDIAELLSKGVTVLIEVTGIEDDDIIGVVKSFENYEEEFIDGIKEGDQVTFKIQKVRCFLR